CRYAQTEKPGRHCCPAQYAAAMPPVIRLFPVSGSQLFRMGQDQDWQWIIYPASYANFVHSRHGLRGATRLTAPWHKSGVNPVQLTAVAQAFVDGRYWRQRKYRKARHV